MVVEVEGGKRVAFRRRRMRTPASFEAVRYPGHEDLEVVGEANYQSELASAARRHGRRVDAVLMPEPDNPYDRNAIAVLVDGQKVGYLPRESASRLLPGLRRLMTTAGKPIALVGRIVGGAPDRPSYGIWLDYDPADFGLSRTAEPEPVVTGESRTEDDPDSRYTMDWAESMPTSPGRAIPWLRRRLETETRPLSRHFMFNHLEAALYKSRDAFASALDEYDEVCEQHDAEMDGIVAAFVAEWGDIPHLDTYEQKAIRHQKQHDYEQALRWAERGLEFYGVGAARAESVEDFEKRVERYRSKLNS